MLTLVRRSFGRIAVAWAAAAAVLAGFQLAITAAAASLEQSGDFSRLVEAVPAFVREWIGPALASFAGMSVLSFFEPLVILLVVLFAVYVASEPAADVESGLVDLILARPLPRRTLITRSLVLMTATTAGLVLVLTATSWISLMLLSPPDAVWPQPRIVLLLTANLFAIGWSLGGVSLGAAGSLPRRASVLGLMTVSIIALFLLKILVESSATFESLWWATPFYFFRGTAILTGDAELARDFTVLFVLGAAGVALAYWRYERRDL
jgi:ABC-2 type transport system permease protein